MGTSLRDGLIPLRAFAPDPTSCSGKPGDSSRSGGGIGQKRQQVDLRVPKVMSLISMAGDALGRHTRVLRTRRSLKNVKKIEADCLLRLDGAALYAVFPCIPDLDIAPAPEVVDVLLLRR